jgi:signal transduction histidine kinase
VTIFYTLEDVAAGKPAMEMAGTITAGRFEADTWRVRKDGSRFWSNEITRPLRDAGGQIVGFTKISRDLTERKAFEDALQQAHDFLEHRVQERTSEVQALFERLISAQEEERRRIARDIHDQLGQSMTALRMQLEALHLRSERHVELSADVSRVDRLAQELDENIDFLTWQLRPAALDRLGLSPAVADLVRGWSERFQIAADYHAYSPSAAPLTPETSVNIYRIVQEALHNVHKHARASHVSVMLSVRDSHLSVVIEDDGRGFDPGIARAPHDGSLGLVGMRERAILIGGEFTIESSPGNGTAIFVRVPVAPTR